MGRWKYKVTDICKSDGCNRTARVKGFCENCYVKNRYYENKKDKR
jgi:hypothetical protein